MLDWLYAGFRWVYELLFSVTGNFILSAVLMTLIIRLIMLPLDLRTSRSTRKQLRLQPVIEDINRKYANDAERRNQKTMELYKKEKYNPLSGCLPLLLTWPLFLVLFNTLRQVASEQVLLMYQSMACGVVPPVTGFLWIHNIWQADSFLNMPVIPQLAQLTSLAVVKNHAILTPENIAAVRAGYDTIMRPLIQNYAAINNGWLILPVLCSGVSLLTMRLNPMYKAQNNAPPDPNKKGGMNTKLMQYMGPIMSLIVCVSANTIFTFYWLTSNVWELGKQYVLNKTIFKPATEETK